MKYIQINARSAILSVVLCSCCAKFGSLIALQFVRLNNLNQLYAFRHCYLQHSYATFGRMLATLKYQSEDKVIFNQLISKI